MNSLLRRARTLRLLLERSGFSVGPSRHGIRGMVRCVASSAANLESGRDAAIGHGTTASSSARNRAPAARRLGRPETPEGHPGGGPGLASQVLVASGGGGGARRGRRHHRPAGLNVPDLGASSTSTWTRSMHRLEQRDNQALRGKPLRSAAIRTSAGSSPRRATRRECSGCGRQSRWPARSASARN